MQADSTVVERPGIESRRARAVSSLMLSAGVMLVFCLSPAQAQNDPASKPAPAVEAAATPTPTPAAAGERTAADTPDASDTAEAEKDAAEAAPKDSTEAAPAVEEKGTAVAAKGPAAEAKGDDRLDALRSKIAESKTDAERARAQRMLVDYLVALGKRGEAVAELRAMSREERLDPIFFYNTGNALARLGETESAIESYRKAIEQRHGNYARALNNLGVVLLRQGSWDEAQEALTSALKLENFRYGEASYNLGRLYAARGEADLAIREWSRTLSVAPDHADAAVALARAYAEDGSPERGLAVLDKFTAGQGATDEIKAVRRGIISAEAAGAAATAPEGDTGAAASGKAAGAGLRALTVDRETYDLLQRARTAREAGRNDEAAKFYRRVLARYDGLFPPANLELSFVLNAMKRYDESIAALLLVTGREGARYPIAYYHLGRQYEQLGNFGLAAKAYEQATELYGDTNPQFLLDLSRVRDKEGDAQAALAAMEAYVSITRRQGRAPEWSQTRLAQLREKAGQK